MRVRAILATTLALAAASVPALAGQQLARACTFGSDVHVPAGYAARVDRSCHLVIEPFAGVDGWGELGLPAGPDAMPKTPSVDSTASSPAGLVDPIVGQLDVPDVAQEGYRTKIGFSELVIFDEYDRVMYDDAMSYTYQRRVRDGSMTAAEPHRGLCDTASDIDPDDPVGAIGSAPYDPYVVECYANLITTTSSKLVFESGGWYGTTVGVFGVGQTKDRRSMYEHWVADRSGFRSDLSYCNLGGSLPTGPTGTWTHVCVMQESDFA